ncbi:MAG: hypothetical protein E7158_06625 [Firmicutes bacterium]|nr:hypothetical protein [Bacillota bacterium]
MDNNNQIQTNQNVESLEIPQDNSNISLSPKKKSNKGLIIFLILIIIGLCGYITYDKVLKDKYFSKENNSEKTNNEVNEIENNDSKSETNTTTDNNSNNTNLNDNNSTDNNNSVQSNLNTKTVEVSKQEIITYVKNELISKKLVNQSNTEKWTFDRAVYMGYFKSNPSEKYYKISGVFKCKDSSYSCVYQEQLEDPNTNDEYPWAVVVPIIFKNDQYSFGSIGGGGSYEFYSPEFNLIEKDL